jgi:TANK-binding kinase 1
MELCNGGSLYEVIDSPVNAMGLEEQEFKLVMSDVAQGLAHLRKHGFVHRDIKPGNIMRTIEPDGKLIFKLADFGTARKLGPNERFTSLHGTEEYLYPAMYERALIDPRSQEEFRDKVDLWSVGATFFHLATGRLPFQPFEKRRDRATMLKITTEKSKGVILGWQTEHGGKIFYSKDLPPDIRLSVGLRNVLTPILAGLLDNFENMLEFHKFFESVERIAQMKVVDVFCVSRCTSHKIYLDMHYTDVIPVLKEQISVQTTLNPKHMEFYFENLPFIPKGPIRTIDLPDTTVTNIICPL